MEFETEYILILKMCYSMLSPNRYYDTVVILFN